jgi:hypothetical protein
MSSKKKAAALKTPPSPPAGNSPKLNAKQLTTRRNKAKEGNLKLCKELWPDAKDSQLWLQEDRSKKGFVWMPRPMPLFVNLINDTSKHVTNGKAVPAGRSYLVLWCRVRDGAFLDIENEAAAALDAGYGGERNIATWHAHLRILKDLGFIDYKPGPSGPYQFILLWNPYHVVKKLRAKGWVQDAPYIAIRKRTLEIGAIDMDDE